MIFVGIDPGITGAVVLLDDQGGLVSAWRTPSFGTGKKEYDLQAMEAILHGALGGACACTIEKVGAMPTDGRVGAFNFGKGYGIWLGMLSVLNIGFQEVTPQRWQSRMLAGQPKGKQTKTSAVKVAKQLWPDLPIKVKADWGMADAALIAEFGRRVSKGEAR